MPAICCRRSTVEPSRSRRGTALPDFSGKVAIVTGAASGLGLAIAERLASDRAALVLADLDVEAAEAARDSIVARGARALAQRSDVSEPSEVTMLIARTLEEFGRLDIMVSNAGIETHAFLDEPVEHWNRVL